jgi:hypothetical protein
MRHLIGAKLGGTHAKVYIELMRSPISSAVWLPLLAAAALGWAPAAGAQVFSADYGLSPAAVPAMEASSQGSAVFSLGGVGIGPALQADAGFSGAGLSLQAGRNWFAQVAVGQSLSVAPGLPMAVSGEALRIGGGYRWGNGQALSLQVTGSRGPERLGLSVSYDWPRYFVRLSYDGGLNPVPQDRLRFSAGVRF